MRKVFLNCVLLLCALIAGSSSVWADDAPVNTVLWGENFGHFGTNTPSTAGTGSGTTIYGGATISYSQDDTGTKAYNEKLAGGTAPELLLKKSNKTWTISGIKTGGATEMTLTFLSNKSAFAVTTNESTKLAVSGSGTSWTFTVKDGQTTPTTFNITIKNTSSNDNARIDNVQLKVTTAAAGATSYAISIADGISHGSVEASATAADADEEITLTPHPDAGYEFTSWDVYKTGETSTKVTVTNNKFTMPAYGVTVSATFTALPTYTITKAVVSNGTIECDESAYEGKEVSLKATPAAGYEFTSWDVYKTGESSTKVTVTNNKFTMPAYGVTVSASFSALPTYTITKDAVTNGTIACDASGYNGKTVSLTATPNSGYALAYWSVYKTDDPSTKIAVADGKFTMPDYAVSVFAEFMQKVTDNLTTSTFDSPNSYTSWTNKTATSNAIYAGNSTTYSSSAIQIRATSPSGVLTIASGGKARKVTITWNSETVSGRTLDVYGKNTAYTAATDLYSNTASVKGIKLGSIVYGTSTELTIAGDYAYIGLRSNSGAMYLDEIDIDWAPCRDLTVSATEWATLYLPFAADIPSGVKAYYVNDINESTLKLTEINSTIPAQTGVLINAAAGTYTFMKSSSSPSAPATNYLKGNVTTGNTTGADTGDKYYRLSWDGSDAATLGFYYGAVGGDKFSIEANRAYLLLPAAKVPSAPSIRFDIDDENNATNIETLESSDKAVKFIENGNLYILREGIIYDALGRVIR